jgi:hypothetical protein
LSYSFDEVKEGDFMQFGKPLSFLEIERTLQQIGGGGVHGTEYKNEVLKVAGWNGHALKSYASRPELAAKAFNRVRSVLSETDDAEKVMSRVAELVQQG